MSIYDILAQVRIGAEKKKTNFVVFGVKKNSYAKFIVLRLMVTRYIGNMIAFLRCY